MALGLCCCFTWYSFHSPVEASRIISSGLKIVQEGRLKLSRLLYEFGVKEELPYPAINNKHEAQVYIGLDPAKMKANKEEFKKNIIPQWVKEAEAREAKMPTGSKK